MKVDAIVNAANTHLQMGAGVSGAIFKAAGLTELQTACNKLSPINTGDAAITPGFALPATYIIHAVGPIYHEWSSIESEQLLRTTYLSALRVAIKNNCESIAFPLISSGIYGFPKEDALRVATEAIRDFLSNHELDVYLALYDKATLEISEKLLDEVESYLDEHYYEEDIVINRIAINGLDDVIGNLDEPFSDTLLRLIDAKGMTDVEVYKRANLDRKLFSKIRTGKGYSPSKRTAIALAIALRLTLDETDDLLRRLGYALSHSQKFDVIVEYFIIEGIYDIFTINEILFKYDQPLLGG